MRYTYMTLVLFCALFMLCSCGWKVDGMERLEDLYMNDGDVECDGECVDEVVDGDMSEDDVDEAIEDGDEEYEINENANIAGTWAMKMVLNGTMAPVVVEWQITLTNLFVATVDEDQKTISLEFCDQITHIEGSNGFGETEVPETLKSALAASPIEIDLQDMHTIPATTVAWTWGINLENPETDDISKVELGDSRIVDQDDDGNAGVTMIVKTPAGERYMVRRSVWNLKRGQLSEDQMWIDGTLQFKVDEKAVDADNDLLKTVAPITSATEGNTYTLYRTTEPVAADGEEGDSSSKSGFKAGEGITCEQLIGQYESIFAR